ncbi:MAG: PEP-CTERM sorting domain-containing protein [Planctomycetaceae bacterium]|jgi:hypothetical protein|nr:PEP-CTERM sorting domain-containing protein [Planctomycetaceae bacterium]
MKTFLISSVFAAVLLGFTVSVSADTAFFDWNNPNDALVFTTQIAAFSYGQRPVEIDYAVKDNVLYSRIKFDNPSHAEFVSHGLNIFGGNEQVAGNSQDNSFYSKNTQFWNDYKFAVQNYNVYTIDIDIQENMDADDQYFIANTFTTKYLTEEGKKKFINDVIENPYYDESIHKINALYTYNKGISYLAGDENFVQYASMGHKSYSGTTFTATYADEHLSVLANNEFLSGFNTYGNYLEYAVNLDGLGLDNYNGIHIGSQMEGYYTFLDFSEGTFHAATPEPATLLIFGLAGGIAIPFLRRKKR